jgi:hypothetical protein
MRASEEYRQKAGDCFARANLTDDPSEKADLLALALQWRRLAEQTEVPNRVDTPPPPEDVPLLPGDPATCAAPDARVCGEADPNAD